MNLCERQSASWLCYSSKPAATGLNEQAERLASAAHCIAVTGVESRVQCNQEKQVRYCEYNLTLCQRSNSNCLGQLPGKALPGTC